MESSRNDKPAVPPLNIAGANRSTTVNPKSPKHSSSSHSKLTHRYTTKFSTANTEKKRPTADLITNVDGLEDDLKKINVNDEGIIDIKQLNVLRADLQQVVAKYEERPEFKIAEKISLRKRELDVLIEQAEKDYAEKKFQHDQQVTLIDDQLLEMHRKMTEVQTQTLITQLKDMEAYQYYHNKVIQQIEDISLAMEAASCCSRLFCCFPSKEILQKRKQLQLLQDEQDALASNDRTKVSQALMSRMEGDRQELLEKKKVLAGNQPQETAQQLRDERTKLQADIDANRDEYYYAINPATMLNLVRIQSFVKRMKHKIERAKGDTPADDVKSGLLHAALKIVTIFINKFDDICSKFVCRPPQNQSNKISYAQYCGRYHKLKEDEKMLLIRGPSQNQEKSDAVNNQLQNLTEQIFPEHTQPDFRAESSASLTNKLAAKV